MRPAGRVQLVVGNGASVLVRSVGGQVLRSHTRGVLKRLEDGEEKQNKMERGERERERKRREDVKGGVGESVERRGDRNRKERQTCWERKPPEGEIEIRAGNNEKRERKRGREGQGGGGQERQEEEKCCGLRSSRIYIEE